MSVNYLTPQGFHRLRDELRNFLEVERPKVVEAVNVAAAMGDRSENAEYIYGKRRLREIDSRIRFLSKRLEEVEIVDPSKVSVEKVAFGVWVVVQDEEGARHSYQIVGQDEIDTNAGRITFSSPIGKALLGKRVGDVITVQRPKGAIEVEILEIRNKAP
jgi:transcription elongation factor GreB